MIDILKFGITYLVNTTQSKVSQEKNMKNFLTVYKYLDRVTEAIDKMAHLAIHLFGHIGGSVIGGLERGGVNGQRKDAFRQNFCFPLFLRRGARRRSNQLTTGASR